MNKIVTISREFGSGGREVGRRLAALVECFVAGESGNC